MFPATWNLQDLLNSAPLKKVDGGFQVSSEMVDFAYERANEQVH